MIKDKQVVSQKAEKTSKNKEMAATMVEYGLLVALLSVVCIAAVNSFSTQVNRNFSMIDSTIDPYFFGG